MQSWEAEFRKGTLNEIQSRFFQTKPLEELYDVHQDPHNIHNLADDPEYGKVLDRMRRATMEWMVDIRDVGLIPEAMIERISEHTTLYEYARSGEYPIEKILPSVVKMTDGNLRSIRNGLKNRNDIIRYWAATSALIYADQSMDMIPELKKLLKDELPAIRIASAEALYYMGETEDAKSTLTQALESKYEKTRLQALNVLFGFDEKDLEPVWPAVTRLIPDDENNRNYDVRAAKGLLLKFGRG